MFHESIFFSVKKKKTLKHSETYRVGIYPHLYISILYRQVYINEKIIFQIHHWNPFNSSFIYTLLWCKIVCFFLFWKRKPVWQKQTHFLLIGTVWHAGLGRCETDFIQTNIDTNGLGGNWLNKTSNKSLRYTLHIYVCTIKIESMKKKNEKKNFPFT